MIAPPRQPEGLAPDCQPKATTPARMLPLCVLLLVVLTLALRLPTLGGVSFTPDAAEYAGAARRLAEGRGLTTAIKWHFYDKGPVVRPLSVERPILFPLLGGALLRLTGTAEPLSILQTANAALSLLNALLALAAFRTVVPLLPACVGAGLLALSPPMVETATVALCEQLFLALWLAALLLLPRVGRPGAGFAFGILAGLATLTRPNGLLLLLAPPAALRGDGRRSVARALALAAAGMALILLPAFLCAAMQRPPGVRAGALVNFSVLHIHEATWGGFGREIPSPLAFVADHPPQVAIAIARKALANLGALWLSLGPVWLLLLLPRGRRGDDDGPPLPPPILGGDPEPAGGGASGASGPPLPPASFGKIGGGHPPALRRAWLVLAAANFALYSLAWAAAGATRYLLPTTALLLPLLLERGTRRARGSRHGRVLAAVVLAAAAASMAAHWGAYGRECRRRWDPTEWARYHQAAQWLGEMAGPEDVVASNNPWMVHTLTRRPAVACPNLGPGADLGAFARRFGVRWMVLFSRRSDPRLRHCLAHPGARLVRESRDSRGRRTYLFAVGPPAGR